MRKAAALILVLVAVCMATSFGRNKVQTGEREWWEIRARHFTIYFPRGGEIPAESLLVYTETELLKLSEQFNYLPENPIPIVLYTSPGDFRQTNINPYEISQAVGGFTEFYKGRVVIPFTGYWSEFRHVVAHELNHAFIFDMLYQRSLLNIITGGTPLWMMEGLAEYTSLGWDAASEAEFRDMVIANQIVPIQELSRRSDYLVYREGQAIYHFINERYGEDVLRNFVRRIGGRRYGQGSDRDDSGSSSNGKGDPFNVALGMSLAQFNEKFLEWARETYWSELAYRESPGDLGNPIYEGDDRVLQIGSVISNDGSKITGVEWHHAHFAVAVRSALTGELISRPFVSGGADDASVSPMYRICDFSPGADSIVIAVQYISGDRILIFSDNEKITLPFEMDLIRDPSWSPCGRYIAFSGMNSSELDIYVWDMQIQSLIQLTNDIAGERDLSWSGTGVLCNLETGYSGNEIRRYQLDGSWETLLSDSFEIRYPIDVSDGILFLSNASGYPDLYILDESSGVTERLTALYKTIDSPSWADSSGILTFVSEDWGGTGVFLAYDILQRRVISSEPGFYDISAVEPSESMEEQDIQPVHDPIQDEKPAEVYLHSDRRQDGVFREFQGDLISDAEMDINIVPYSPRLSVDYASALAAYDSYLGLAGYTQIILSDILAHHRVIIYTNLNGGSLSDVDIAAHYGYLPRRLDMGCGIFRESYRYLFHFSDGHREEVRDVDFGGYGMASYPFNPSFRIDGSLSYRRLSRTGLWNSNADIDEDILSVTTRAVFDNALWGSVGPRVGRRLSISCEYAPGISGSASYTTLQFDLRNYLWVSGRVTLATRFAGGTSWGEDAQDFFLGGAVSHRLLWGEVDTLDELLGFYMNYGDQLRGYDYASLSGRRYGLFTTELRVPFINTLALDAPLPITLRNGRGVFFIDLGCAFDDLADFRGASTDGGFHLDDLRMGIGLGYRINLGFFLLKHDIAWRTDIRGISRKPQQYLTLGAEF